MTYAQKLRDLNATSKYKWVLVGEGSGYACESSGGHYYVAKTKEKAVNAACAAHSGSKQKLVS